MCEDEFGRLASLYGDIDGAISRFQQDSSVFCPGGCGICCTRFTPDILPLEAEFLFHWMLRNDPERLDALLQTLPGLMTVHRQEMTCPLYRPENPYHCSAYEARPLVCRLFGFSAIPTKGGEREFADCRHMPLPAGLARGKRWPAEDPDSAPSAERFGRYLSILRPGESGERELLPSALQRAAARILLSRRLTAS